MQVYVTGGKGNSRIVAWSYVRNPDYDGFQLNHDQYHFKETDHVDKVVVDQSTAPDYYIDLTKVPRTVNRKGNIIRFIKHKI